MSQSITERGECSHFFAGEVGPLIKILIYTDEPLEVSDDVVKDWSLGVMLQHLKAHAPAFASLCIKFVSRNSTLTTHADKRIDDLVKNGDFDQIWFFGIHQGNRANFSMEVLRGGPHSELDEAEVEALRQWMRVGGTDGRRGGGVLMTGDHAEPRPPDALPPATGTGVEEFWGLGRALGFHVPRAGQMRRWEGPPSRRAADSQNTQVLSLGTNFEDALLQFDTIPQRLILETFDAKGELAKGGQPHPLFIYRAESFIQLYPDHMHEGRAVVPEDKDLANQDVWPSGQVVKPQVVARGTDNAKKLVVDLIAAYNGDRAGVGRIVADSTWHHYFNVNLNRFAPPGDVNSPTDQLGQYYSNLAIWLTPLDKRREMADAMVKWLATHPVMLEERVLADLSDEELTSVLMHIGEKARHLLSQVASQCEIHELINVLIPEGVSAGVGTVFLPEKGFTFASVGPSEFLLPSKELLLGSYVNLYHRNIARAESSGEGPMLVDQARKNVAAEGFKRALEIQNNYVMRLASASKQWFE